MRKGVIYGLICPISKQIRYVGRTIQPIKIRFKKHKYEHRGFIRKNKHLSYRSNWIKKLDDKGLLHKLGYIIIENCAEDIIDEREIYWIKYYKDSGYKLTNLTDGGDGMLGHIQSYNHKRKATEGVRKSYKNNPEIKNNISKSLKKYFENNPHPFGKNNHASISIFAINIKTNENIRFVNSRKCAKHFNIHYKLLSYLKIYKKIFNNWIFYNTYNIHTEEYSIYGAIPDHFKSIVSMNINTKKYKQFDHARKCADHFKISTTNIRKYIHNKTIVNNWIFYPSNIFPDFSNYVSLEDKRNPNSKKIIVRNLINGKIQKFNSISSCNKFFKSYMVKFYIDNKMIHGDHIFYHSDIIPDLSDYTYNQREILAIHKDSNILKFKDNKECQKHFSISRPQLSVYINKRKIFNDYFFTYRKDYNPETFDSSSYISLITEGFTTNKIRMKVVNIMDDSIRIFSSQLNCMREIEITTGSLNRYSKSGKPYKGKYILSKILSATVSATP